MPSPFRRIEASSLQSQRGFTMVELIMVIVIAGILAAVAAPRFFDADVFRSRGFSDEVKASLRYAQKAAIAQRRFVCVAFTANRVTLTTGSTAACGADLQSPDGDASYVINAPANTEFAGGVAPANFSFDCLGRPRTAGNAAAICGNNIGVLAAVQVVQVQGVSSITVEAETGYVH